MEHESYGMVTFSRITGHPGRLFGSHLKDHHTFVRLVLKRAQRVHNLSHDWYFAKNPILVELDLSAAQFADLITTMNSGDGTPCTIRFLDGREMDRPPDEELEAEKVRTSFRNRVAGIGDKLRKTRDEVEEILAKKGSIGVADRRSISAAFSRFITEVEQNMPFVLECFEESAQKVVSHAKAEVDAFTTQTVIAAGLDALAKRGDTKELGDGSEGALALPDESDG